MMRERHTGMRLLTDGSMLDAKKVPAFTVAQPTCTTTTTKITANHVTFKFILLVII